MLKLITQEFCKQMLRIDTDEDDPLLDAFIVASSELVVHYLKDQAASVIGLNDSGIVVDADAIPYRVRCATAMMVGYLRNNPDGDPDKYFEMGYLPKPVMALLYMDRDPTLA